MKKKLFLSLCFVCIAALQSNAQLRVDSIGHTGFGPANITLYSGSAGTWGRNLYQTYIVGSRHGLYSECFNTTFIHDWGYAIDGFADVDSYDYAVGVKATALRKAGTGTGSRAYGLFARAGQATNGYNYAVFGNLMNLSDGAAVFGTTVNNSMGEYTGGRYAGYFVGDVKVKGNVNVVNGTILINSVPYSASSNKSTSTISSLDENTSDKLSNLTSVSYYNNPTVSKNSIAVEAESDTTSSETELTGVKDPDKVH